MPKANIAYTPTRRRTLSGTIAAASLLSIAAVAQPPAPHPDADLIRICAEHAVNTQAVNASPDEMDDDHPLWAAYTCTQRAIDAAKPHTVAGMLAKARIAVDVSTYNGVVTPENGSGATWAWDLLNDLQRLNGAAA